MTEINVRRAIIFSSPKYYRKFVLFSFVCNFPFGVPWLLQMEYSLVFYFSVTDCLQNMNIPLVPTMSPLNILFLILNTIFMVISL